MRIEFQCTIDDFVDAQERVTKRSRVGRSWYRQGAALSALLTGLIGGVPIFIFSYARWPLGVALTWGLGVGIACAAIGWKTYGEAVRKRLRKYFRERYGDRVLFPCTVEISEAGVRVEQLGSQHLYEWSNVEEISESEDAVEVYMRSGGGLFVKKRFFSAPEEIGQFMGAAQHRLNLSRTSSNWLRGD